MTYGNGLFVAIANDGTNRVMTAPDGVTWTAHPAAEADELVAHQQVLRSRNPVREMERR